LTPTEINEIINVTEAKTFDEYWKDLVSHEVENLIKALPEKIQDNFIFFSSIQETPRDSKTLYYDNERENVEVEEFIYMLRKMNEATDNQKTLMGLNFSFPGITNNLADLKREFQKIFGPIPTNILPKSN